MEVIDVFPCRLVVPASDDGITVFINSFLPLTSDSSRDGNNFEIVVNVTRRDSGLCWTRLLLTIRVASNEGSACTDIALVLPDRTAVLRAIDLLDQTRLPSDLFLNSAIKLSVPVCQSGHCLAMSPCREILVQALSELGIVGLNCAIGTPGLQAFLKYCIANTLDDDITQVVAAFQVAEDLTDVLRVDLEVRDVVNAFCHLFHKVSQLQDLGGLEDLRVSPELVLCENWIWLDTMALA